MRFILYLFALLSIPLHVCRAQDRPDGLRRIELEDVYGKNTFEAKQTRGFRFSADGVHYYQMSDNGDLLRFDLRKGHLVDTVLSRRKITRKGDVPLSLYGATWNRTEDLLLLHSQKKNIYRFSFTSIPWVYDLKKDSLFRLTDRPVSNVSFSPSGRQIAYCRENNIYVLDIDTKRETQLTQSAVYGAVQNGVADWVYEETFGVVQAYKWSGDGRYLAYYEFDTSQVPTYTFPLYASKSTDQENYAYKYYRPGEPISRVRIHIYDLETGKVQWSSIPDQEEYYCPRIYWSKDHRSLYIYRMPRNQKSVEVGVVDITKATYTTVLTEQDERYIDRATFDAFYSFADGNRFIYMSEKEGWRKLYLYDQRSKQETCLTPFLYDVDRLVGVNEKDGMLYCSVAEDPKERQVLAVDIDKSVIKPITTSAGWNTLLFNSDFNYYLKTFSTVTSPPEYTVHNISGKEITTIEDNAGLKDTLQRFALSSPNFLRIPNRKGTELEAWVLFPPDYTEDKKYPVLFTNYGGPGSQRVMNQWGLVNFWHQHLVQQGIIVVCVDNTGTGYRGTAFKKAVYGQLGIQEIEDQIDAVGWLTKRYPSMDSSRVAFWGWSFGGFMSSMAITYGADVFSTAVAIAPVTDWKLYQSGYAERHMGLPEDNPEGYEKSTPLAYADRMKGNLLLIHGTADDNVHFRHSAVFSQNLIAKGKQFEQYYYPDKDHAIAGTSTRFHLYRLVTEYLMKTLKVENNRNESHGKF